MKVLLPLFLSVIFVFNSVRAVDQSAEVGAQMMLKIAAAELLDELTSGQVTKVDLLEFAEGMTSKYPRLYTLKASEIEKILAGEPIATAEEFDAMLVRFKQAQTELPDLLSFTLSKREARAVTATQAAFAYQYLKALCAALEEAPR